MMCKKKESTLDLVPASQAGSMALMVQPGALLLSNRTQSRAEAGIVQQTQTDLTRERAYLAKGLYGQQVLHAAGVATEQNFVRFVEADRALRSRVQDEVDQVDVEKFCDRMRTDHANALLAMHGVVVDKVRDVVAAPVDPPPGSEEEIVTAVPNLLQRIFGGQTVTRVRR